jgi:hypothetical protein
MSSQERADSYETAFGALGGTYLEDSWVLDLIDGGQIVTFDLDLVLTPEHSRYRPPAPGEHYCYKRARLTVASSKRLELHGSGAPPATDASGEHDLGNIDLFAQVDWDGEEAWEMSGDWGDLLAVQPSVGIAFD